jgi:hypothetical protein
MTSELTLLQRLLDGCWRSILGMQPKTLTPTYAEVAALWVDTDRGRIDIGSEEKKIAGKRDRLFSLRIHPIDANKEWLTRSGSNVVTLTQEWQGGALTRLGEPPRKIRFFTNDRYQRTLEPPATILDDCEAIEIASYETPDFARLVIAVDSRKPGLVKVALGELDRERVLQDLAEIKPPR